MQILWTGSLEEKLEADGRLGKVAAIEGARGQQLGGFHARIGVEEAPHHLIEVSGVAALLGQLELLGGRAAVGQLVKLQALGGQVADHASGLTTDAGDDRCSLLLTDLPGDRDEYVFLTVEQLLENLDGLLPVLDEDIVLGRLDLVFEAGLERLVGGQANSAQIGRVPGGDWRLLGLTRLSGGRPAWLEALLNEDLR